MLQLVAISEYLVRSLQDSSHWTVDSDGMDSENGCVDIGKIYQSKVSESTTADIINLDLILSNVVSADGISLHI